MQNGAAKIKACFIRKCALAEVLLLPSIYHRIKYSHEGGASGSEIRCNCEIAREVLFGEEIVGVLHLLIPFYQAGIEISKSCEICFDVSHFLDEAEEIDCDFDREGEGPDRRPCLPSCLRKDTYLYYCWT